MEGSIWTHIEDYQRSLKEQTKFSDDFNNALSFEEEQEQSRVLTFSEVIQKYKCVTSESGGPSGLKSIASGIITEHDQDDTFYIIDLMNTHRLYKAWINAMPRVQPFYAVKCSPERALVETLLSLGAGFDCASAAEIDLALQCGCKPENIIFAQPCKRPHEIRYAKSVGVFRTTFDSVSELRKIAQHYPEMQVVLRIRADDPTAELPLGAKFGANMNEIESLLQEVQRLKLDMIGVSFHVGSLARDPFAFSVAIQQARRVFDMAEEMGFTKMSFLDLGGGFTGRFDADGNVMSMTGDIPVAINAALEQCFPDPSIKVIAEPGRYFAEMSGSLVTHVHGHRERSEKVQHNAVTESSEDTVAYNEYWISDGLYGSFNGVIYDHAVPRAWLLPSPNLPALDESRLVRSTVFGPTCDSLDVVFKDVLLPRLRVGDWLLFPGFGAYSWAGATNFNGIQAMSCKKFYILSKSPVDDVDTMAMWACEMTTKPCSLVA